MEIEQIENWIGFKAFWNEHGFEVFNESGDDTTKLWVHVSKKDECEFSIPLSKSEDHTSSAALANMGGKRLRKAAKQIAKVLIN